MRTPRLHRRPNQRGRGQCGTAVFFLPRGSVPTVFKYGAHSMAVLSDTDWATLAVAFTAVVAALVLNPRILRLDTLQRRKWMAVLTRLSPAIRNFYSKMGQPSNRVRISFLSGAGAVMLTAVLIKLYVGPPLEFQYAVFFLWFWTSIVVQNVNRRVTRGLSAAFKDPSISHQVAQEHHWRAPAVILRGWVVMLILDMFVALLVVVDSGIYASPSSWTLLGIIVVFAPIYLLQQVDLQAIVENVLFRSSSVGESSDTQVVVSVTGSVGDISGTVRGSLSGIGSACQVRRDDGYLEEVAWGMIWRLGVKP